MVTSSGISRVAARLVWTLSLAAAAGCSSRTDSSEVPTRPHTSAADTVNGVQYSGELRIMESFPVQLAADVVVTNVSQQFQHLAFPDGCVVLLRAYRGEERVFDQASVVGCTMAVVEVDLAPGQSESFHARSDGYEILGSSLSDGRYRITGYLRPNGELVNVELGEADLAIPRD